MPDFQNQKKVRVKSGIGLKIYVLVGFEISLDLSFSVFGNFASGGSCVPENDYFHRLC